MIPLQRRWDIVGYPTYFFAQDNKLMFVNSMNDKSLIVWYIVVEWLRL